MRLIKPSVERIIQEPGLQGIYKQIERIARVCYKSENKICEGSAEKMVNMLIKNGHGAMLEHGTVYLAIPITTHYSDCICNYEDTPYARIHTCDDYIFKDKFGNDCCAWCITTNYRYMVEHELLDDLEFLCEPTEYHEKRYSFKFIMDRIGSQSFCRHRVFSFAQESTRFCNYSKDKFDNRVTYIIPSNLNIPEGIYDYWDGDWCDVNNCKITLPEADEDNCANEFLFSLLSSEQGYFNLLNKGWQPQQARQVLPFALKTELVMTGFKSDWKHFFDLRCASNAHPDAQYLAKQVQKILDTF